jgi:hypothetical protein
VNTSAIPSRSCGPPIRNRGVFQKARQTFQPFHAFIGAGRFARRAQQADYLWLLFA